MNPEQSSEESRDEYLRAVQQACEEGERQAEHLANAHATYARQIREASTESARRSCETYGEYVKATQEASLQAEKRSFEAHSKHQRRMIESWQKSDAQLLCMSAAYEYEKELYDISAILHSTIAECEHKYRSQMLQISQDTERTFREAEKEFVLASHRPPA